jgi:hypothetical protein
MAPVIGVKNVIGVTMEVGEEHCYMLEIISTAMRVTQAGDKDNSSC